jgi:hypothetical protein
MTFELLFFGLIMGCIYAILITAAMVAFFIVAELIRKLLTKEK